MLAEKAIKLTVPSSDNGIEFTKRERLDLMEGDLSSSHYKRSYNGKLSKIYRHPDFQESRAFILLSCHIDSIYDNYYAKVEGHELHGTLDNSVCNAILLVAMLREKLPAQVLVAFTGDEEDNSLGVTETVAYLERSNLFTKLELVITLDITELGYGSKSFTVENYFVEKENQNSLLRLDKKKDLKKYLSRFLDVAPLFVPDGDEDESWAYDEHDLNCFSLCLPCKLLGKDMHDDEGVAVTLDSLDGFITNLICIVESISLDLAEKAT